VGKNSVQTIIIIPIRSIIILCSIIILGGISALIKFFIEYSTTSQNKTNVSELNFVYFIQISLKRISTLLT